MSSQMNLVVAESELRYFEELLPSICKRFVPPAKVKSCAIGDSSSCSDLDAVYAFVGFHALELSLFQAHSVSVLFYQTEQLTRSEKLVELVAALKCLTQRFSSVTVVDYSKKNVEFLWSALGPSYVGKIIIKHEPFIPDKQDVKMLCQLLLETPKTAHFALLGTLSANRLKTAETFRRNGFKVDVVTNVFGIERDLRVASCRVLLNTHYDASYGIFEQARCTRWIAAGMTVITEKCDDEIPIGTFAVCI